MARTPIEAQNLKQVWLTELDQKNVDIIAQKLEAEGHDVRWRGSVSLTKIIRVLLSKAAKDLPAARKEQS